MATMMALRAHKRGGPEELIYEEAPVPEPGETEVLVAVHAASITFAELGWDETWKNADGQDRTPTIPSHEVSGVVSSRGPRARAFEVGAEVYGLIDFPLNGAAAEFVAVPESALAPRPRTLDHIESASLPLAGLTALQALEDHGKVQPGERVLVLGGSGGVGSYLVQLAHVLGARVSATARAGDLDLVRSLGAEQVVDYRSPDFATAFEPADLVIDAAGTDDTAAVRFTRDGGRLVSLAGPVAPELLAGRDVSATFFVVEESRAQLDRLAELADAGSIRVLVAATFPLAEGRRAFEEGPRLGRPGKTVLVVVDG